MNCLQFRRAVATDLNRIGQMERAHAQHCAACAEHGRRLRHFNRVLDAGLKSPVPPNLADRILLRHAFRSRSARRFYWPAMAAGLALLASAALLVMGYLHSESELEHEVIALVEAADYALRARGPIAPDTLSKALEPAGLRIEGNLGTVSFAGRCLVRGSLSGHVVLRDHDAPITVFLMPAENLLRQSRFKGENWSGLLMPAGNGAIAIVAPRGQAVDRVMRQVLDAVRWSV